MDITSKFFYPFGARAFWRLSPCLLLLLLVGCASIDSSDYRQTVLVTSDPPGAKIYEKDRLLGITPAYVRVRRRHHPKITLELPDEAPREVDLKTNYRWGDSFAANFIMLTYAPIGWGIDWATGTAWKIEDPPEQKWGLTRPVADRADVVAIAPPIAPDTEVSEALGPVLENKLRSDGGFEVLPYEKTEPLFGYYSSDQGLTEKTVQRYNLLYELKADHVLVTDAQPTPDGYTVKGDLLNVFTGKSIEEYRWDITPADGALKEEMSAHRFYRRYFRLFPNTFFLNFANFNSNIEIDGKQYEGHSTRGQGFTERTQDYLSAISLAHIERPRANVRGHMVFELVPTLILSNKRIRFNDYKPLQDVQFERWYVSGGYGVELGHLSRIGLFYFDYIPMATWTKLSFRMSGYEQSLSRTTVTSMVEAGYSYFFSTHIVGKLYVRSLSEDLQLWERSVHDITGDGSTVSNVSSVFTGVAIGYYIPSSFKDRTEGWRVVQRQTR